MSSDPINDLLDLVAEQVLHLEVNGGVSHIPCPVKAVQWKYAIKRVHEYRNKHRKFGECPEYDRYFEHSLSRDNIILLRNVADRVKKLEGKVDTLEHEKNTEPMREVLRKLLEIKKHTCMLYAQAPINALVDELIDHVAKEIRKC